MFSGHFQVFKCMLWNRMFVYYTALHHTTAIISYHPTHQLHHQNRPSQTTPSYTLLGITPHDITAHLTPLHSITVNRTTTWHYTTTPPLNVHVLLPTLHHTTLYSASHCITIRELLFQASAVDTMEEHVQYAQSGPCLLLGLMRENAVAKLLDVLGPCDPQLARKQSQFLLRGCYGVNLICNALYGGSLSPLPPPAPRKQWTSKQWTSYYHHK